MSASSKYQPIHAPLCCVVGGYPYPCDCGRDSYIAEHDAAEAIGRSHVDELTENEKLREALTDCLSALAYIKSQHGRLYGVGWGRVEGYAALAAGTPPRAGG